MASSISKRHFSQIVIRRFMPGQWKSGKFTERGYRDQKILASVQPLKGTELVDESVARRTENMVKIYTEFKMETTDQSQGLKADIIFWKGDQYEVHSVSDWQLGNLKHYKVMAKKVINQ